MRIRARVLSVACATTLIPLSALIPAAAASAAPPLPPPAAVDGVARDLRLSTGQARGRLQRQDQAQRVAATLHRSLRAVIAGEWFDEQSGRLAVAVTDQATANAVSAAGAIPHLVTRGKAELSRLAAAVGEQARPHIPGITGWGVDPVSDSVVVTVNRAAATATTGQFLSSVSALGAGVRTKDVAGAPGQQAGTVQPGTPWWPGSESNCSVGFGATDAQGGKVFVTAGHCTNDADQPVYGQSGQQNKIGTSNVGGTHSVDAEEGDMGVVAVTEPGWALSASADTWGGAPVTVTGSTEPLVNQAVCHSGNTSHWQCGKVTAVDQSIDYGNVVVDGLSTTNACSLGGDSGGAWLAGDKAVGLHSGGQSSCTPGSADNQSIFQPVNESLQKWSLTLLTDGGGGTDTQAPTAPANTRSTAATATSVSLAWDASTDNVGVSGYDVYNGSTLATSVAGTSATITGLSPDTAYTFTIRAKDAAGNSSPAGAPVTARTSPGSGDSRVFTSTTAYPIRDFQTVVSAIRSTATGAAVSPVTVQLSATHTCAEDLAISLVSPAGKHYVLQNSGGVTCHPFPAGKTFGVRVTGDQATGTWTLRIADNGPGDIGTLSGWSISV
jgi:streptogrisin C